MEKETKKVTVEAKADFDKLFESESFKTFVESVKAADEKDSGTFEIVITDESVDRYGEIVKSEGLNIDRYMMNPIVLWGHDHYELPVGITTSIEKKDGKTIAKGKFAPASANPKAQQIRELYDLGILRATSIGFIAHKQEGNIIMESELLEFSFVTVPANPNALSTLVKSNISINELVTKAFISIKEQEAAPAEAPKEPEAPVEPVAPVEPAPAAEPATDEATDIVADTGEKTIAIMAGEKELGKFKYVEGFIEKIEKFYQGDKFVSNKAVTGLIEQVKLAVSALEEVALKGDNPEREEPSDSEVTDAKEFLKNRKIIQEAATIIGDVLAEVRRKSDATRS